MIEVKVRHKKGTFEFSADLTIGTGATGIFGPSGAGKTTLLRLIAGIEKPSRGVVKLNEKVLFDSDKRINTPVHKRKIGYVFQEDRLFPHLTVKKNLFFGWERSVSKVGFDDIVDLLEISNLLDQKPAKLSGGQKQRVAIGRALLASPELLLLDEPFSNLDYKIRNEIINYLLRIHRHVNIPMAAVSHELPDILRLTQDIILIDNGRIIAHDNYYNLVGSPGVEAIIETSENLNIFELQVNKQSEDDMFQLSIPKSRENFIKIQVHQDRLNVGKTVRLSLRPEDIALAKLPAPDISIQNQLYGKIKKIIIRPDRAYCLVDCGFPLLSEITTASIQALSLKEEDNIYCLFKSRAVHVVYY